MRKRRAPRSSLTRGPASGCTAPAISAVARRTKLLHFVGRADSQIKSRGYRIELGEIETVLGAVPGIAECAVVGVASGDFDGTAICAAWASRAGAELDPRQLRAALADALPAYMIPSRWLNLPQLPKNANGKIDRPAVRDSFAAGHG